MIGPIGIYEQGHIIELQPGIYTIKALDSWLVRINNFKVRFREVNGDLELTWKKKKLGANDHAFKRKTKSIGEVHVPKWTKYSIHFENQKSLRVIKMNYGFFIGLIMDKAIPPEQVQIVLT